MKNPLYGRWNEDEVWRDRKERPEDVGLVRSYVSRVCKRKNRNKNMEFKARMRERIKTRRVSI